MLAASDDDGFLIEFGAGLFWIRNHLMNVNSAKASKRSPAHVACIGYRTKSRSSFRGSHSERFIEQVSDTCESVLHGSHQAVTASLL